jgi:hypothetical protein
VLKVQIEGPKLFNLLLFFCYKLKGKKLGENPERKPAKKLSESKSFERHNCTITKVLPSTFLQDFGSSDENQCYDHKQEHNSRLTALD